MKSISVADARENIEVVLDAAQEERVVVTRAGKPSVVIIGVEAYDEEDLQLATSPEFWRLIEERRQGGSVPLAELKARLGAKKRPRKSSKGTNSSTKRRKPSRSSTR